MGGLHVAVIGAGIVGAVTAVELLRQGHRVTVVEPDPPGGEQAASYGNGAWIMEASLLPVSTPGLWRAVPGYLADPLGPFAIRPRHLPRAAPWLWRFLRAGASAARVAETARHRHAILTGAFARYRALARDSGQPDQVRRAAHLFPYADRAGFAADAPTWETRRRFGMGWEELEGAELRAAEPGLNHARYRFAARMEGGGTLHDPGAFVAGLAEYAQRSGAAPHRARATGFALDGNRLRAVRTEAGDLACDKAVIAAGIRSAPLAAAAGTLVPLESERGYHAVIPAPAYVPRHAVMPGDGKLALTMTAAGLRAAGQVELAGLDAAPDWRRADVLLAWARRVFPALLDGPSGDTPRWMGHRPSTPDGLPCVGHAAASRDVVLAFGHGHSGLGMAPGTARLAAWLVTETDEPPFDPAPFGPGRF